MIHAFDNCPRIATKNERAIGKAMKEMCGKEGHTATRWPVYSGGYPAPVACGVVCENVLKALAKGPMSIRHIRQHAKHGHPKVALALKELVKRGLVTEQRVQVSVRHYYAQYRLTERREAAE